MGPLLYDELVPWYYLIDPTADHADEVAAYRGALERFATRPLVSLLELGAGAGNNAHHLKARFHCTLTDLSAPMQALSRALNPECEHALGDMRALRLGRRFDAVLVHDAIMYMTTEEDLFAAIQTAYAHLEPGGAAVFAPDCVREDLRDATVLIEGADETRAVRGLEWSWDPDPADDQCSVEYAFLLRDASGVRAVHDRHTEGVFPRAKWLELLARAGFVTDTFARPLDEDGEFDRVFVCRRP